eukprot:5356747-Prymnesium_polylepis.1
MELYNIDVVEVDTLIEYPRLQGSDGPHRSRGVLCGYHWHAVRHFLAVARIRVPGEEDDGP